MTAKEKNMTWGNVRLASLHSYSSKPCCVSISLADTHWDFSDYQVSPSPLQSQAEKVQAPPSQKVLSSKWLEDYHVKALRNWERTKTGNNSCGPVLIYSCPPPCRGFYAKVRLRVRWCENTENPRESRVTQGGALVGTKLGSGLPYRKAHCKLTHLQSWFDAGLTGHIKLSTPEKSQGWVHLTLWHTSVWH